MPVYAGIDIGGTRVKVLLLDGGLNEIDFSYIDSPLNLELNEALELIEGYIKDRADKIGARVKGACFAVPGIVDPVTGRVIECPNLPGWKDFKLSRFLKIVGPGAVIVENDANAGAYGEHVMGAARGIDSFVYVAIGTGVGGGIMLDGRLHRGAFGRAGEIGHVPVHSGGRECSCGGLGHVESYAGGLGILTRAGELLGDLGDLDVEGLYRIALAGNREALNLFKEAGRYLGLGFSSVINVIDVDTFVVGGGVGGALEFMMEGIREEIGANTFGIPPGRVNILAGKNMERAGAIGAGALAVEAFGK